MIDFKPKIECFHENFEGPFSLITKNMKISRDFHNKKFVKIHFDK